MQFLDLWAGLKSNCVSSLSKNASTLPWELASIHLYTVSLRIVLWKAIFFQLSVVNQYSKRQVKAAKQELHVRTLHTYAYFYFEVNENEITKKQETLLTINLSPGQTIATCQRNISKHCWAQHVACVWPPCCNMLGVAGSSLKLVKFEPTTPNISQHIATRGSNARNMLRQAMLRYVVLACWPGL